MDCGSVGFFMVLVSMVFAFSLELKFYRVCLRLPTRWEEPTGRALFGPVGMVDALLNWLTGLGSVIKVAIIKAS